jgi:hypothetical protein
MKMNEVRARAKVLGIKAKNPSKGDLIRMIQAAEGNFDCFGSAGDYCDQEQCAFREECLEPHGKSVKVRGV